MGIQGNTSLMLLEAGDESHPYYKMLKNIEKHVQSGAKLTRQLLDYARKGRYEVRPINVNQLVEETIESFQRARRQVKVHQDLASDLNSIDADLSQIEQVLLNLYINAADAMPGGGHLHITTRNVTDNDMKGAPYKPKKGTYVLLTVADTGMGMDKEVQDRIFEPFFTTKEMGKGTGLGLASVYGIIKGHGGYINVESERGRGTTFKVFLPSSTKKLEKQRSFSTDIVTGKGGILIIDDDENILDLGTRMLEKLGYETFAAENGAQALEIYRENKNKIDLIILDLIMPGIQGGEVYDNIKKINPDAKVLLSSGYSIDGEATKILKRGCNGFLQKPFDIKILSQKIGEIMKSL
jgi:two-component system cell cycle sensor histidine kinase/response regulator CckA